MFTILLFDSFVFQMYAWPLNRSICIPQSQTHSWCPMVSTLSSEDFCTKCYKLYRHRSPIICIVSRNSKILSINYTRSSRVYFPFATVPYLQIFAGLSLSKAEFPWLLWLLWTTRSGRRHGTAATLTKHTTPGRMSFLTRRHDVFVLEESGIISRFQP